MRIYTFRPSRNGKGYDIVLLGGYRPVDSVRTRVEAELAVRRYNLDQNAQRLEAKPPIKPYKKPRKSTKKRVADDFQIPDGFLETISAAKRYIRRGKVGAFRELRASQLGCSTQYLYERMPKARG